MAAVKVPFVVAIQDATAVARDVEIGIAVIVDVAGGRAHPVDIWAAEESGAGRDVGKRPVGLLPIQPVCVGGIAAPEIGGQANGIVKFAAIHQKDVEPPIAVIINQRNAAPHGLKQILLRGWRVAMEERQRYRSKKSKALRRQNGRAEPDCGGKPQIRTAA